MAIASYFIFKDILDSIEHDDQDILEKCRIFMERYPDDRELTDICNRISENMETKDTEQIERIKEDLRELINSRHIEASGGTHLWYRERR